MADPGCLRLRMFACGAGHMWNAWPLKLMKPLLETLKALDGVVKSRGFQENLL